MMSVWRLQPLYGVVSLAICLNASNALDQLQFLVFGGRSRKFSYVMEISTLMDKSRKTTEATRVLGRYLGTYVPLYVGRPTLSPRANVSRARFT